MDQQPRPAKNIEDNNNNENIDNKMNIQNSQKIQPQNQQQQIQQQSQAQVQQQILGQQKQAQAQVQIQAEQSDQIQIISHRKKQIKCGIRQGCEDINTFRRLNRIHQGVYGVVYRAQDIKTKQIVAIKKLKLKEDSDFPITSLRQIAILKAISHQNIIKIRKVSGNLERDRVFIVMEYMQHQIKALLKNKQVFNEEQVKRLMKDLLLGIDFLHQKNIVHRDLKTSNLLYSNQGILKICDFGLARRITSSPMTQQVISLWYRPPQLLLGPTYYTCEVDIWSIGCIFAELVLGDALFQGSKQIQQLDTIFKIVGSPNNQSWPNFKELKNAMYVIGNKYPQNKLRNIIPKNKLSDLGVDLMKKLLTPYPKRRITADKALKHDWFKSGVAQRAQMPTFNAINQMDRVKKMVKT